jgi:hypothetical protein
MRPTKVFGGMYGRRPATDRVASTPFSFLNLFCMLLVVCCKVWIIDRSRRSIYYLIVLIILLEHDLLTLVMIDAFYDP